MKEKQHFADSVPGKGGVKRRRERRIYSDSMHSPRLGGRPGTGPTRSTGVPVYVLERVSCLEECVTSVQPGGGALALWFPLVAEILGHSNVALVPQDYGQILVDTFQRPLTRYLPIMPRGAATPHVNRDTAQEWGSG